MDIIVDGYNLIGAEQGLGGVLEHKRNWLIQRLAAYHRRKAFNVILVFDGWRAGRAEQSQEKRDGIMILYSPLGERADAVIVRTARAKGSGAIVVTSDREICRAVERFGAVAVSSAEFSEILRGLDGHAEYEEEEWPETGTGHEHRHSKSARKRLDKLAKLKL